MDEQELRSLIAQRLRVSIDRVTNDADLLGDLGADSLALAELLGELEELKGVKLNIDELEDIRTVGELFEAIF